MIKRKKTVERNPNLTQKSTRQVFSYHSNRANSQPDRSRKDVFDQQTVTLNRNLKHIPTYIAIFVIIVSLAYTTVLDVSNPQVKTLALATPNILRSNDEYEEGFSKILSSSLFNRSKLSIDTDAISKHIQDEYPELESVSVILPLLGKRPVVQVSPARPVLIVQTANGDTYVVGSNGKALLKTTEVSSAEISNLVLVSDKVTQSLRAGELALSLDTLKFINSVLFQMDAREYKVESITLPEVANELHLKLAGNAYMVKFDLQNDIMTQVGSYFALVDHMTKNNQTAPTEYIDVRIEERAYYK